MKQSYLKTAALPFLPVTLLLLTSCSSTSPVDKATNVTYQAGVPGGTLVENYETKVKVAAIDFADRKVTLVAPDGSKNTFKAAPDNLAFDHLRMGELLDASVTRQLVVFLSKDGPPPGDSTSTLAPKGKSASILTSDTVQRSAKIGAIDLKRHRATLQFSDGTSRTFEVRKDVDLMKANLGDDVVIRTTSAVTLVLNKP